MYRRNLIHSDPTNRKRFIFCTAEHAIRCCCYSPHNVVKTTAVVISATTFQKCLFFVCRYIWLSRYICHYDTQGAAWNSQAQHIGQNDIPKGRFENGRKLRENDFPGWMIQLSVDEKGKWKWRENDFLVG